MSNNPNAQPEPISRRSFLKLGGSLLGYLALASILGLEYIAIEDDWVEITHLTLKVSNLPSNFSGLAIAHITDIHFDRWMTPERFSKTVKMVNALSPDVIALTGDIIESDTPDSLTSGIIEQLADLRARKLKCAVLGNHDHWKDPDLARQILRQSDFQELDNRVYPLTENGQRLFFCGLDDHWEHLDDLDAVTANLPEGSCAILLVHEPDYADISAPTGKFALQLSGHSHGGQISLPFYGPPVVPRYAVKYSSGLYQVEGMYLYTNRGLGMITPRLRFNCRPEIALITLTGA